MKVETKYDINDSFWIINREEPLELIVTSLNAEVTKNGTTVRYTLRGTTQDASYAGMTEEELDKSFCKTKKDLMIKLFKDCLE